MTRTDDLELLRLLTGELSPERARRAWEEMERDPELARRFARLVATWGSLELPEAQPVPPGFAQRVTANLPRRRERGFGGAPAWVQVGGATALALGVWLGVLAGGSLPQQTAEGVAKMAVEELAAEEVAVEELAAIDSSLAEAYGQALAQGLGDDGEAGEVAW